MPDTHWKEAIERWRSLPMEERRRRHLKAIPRHVANSMAMEGEPVDEAWIRERLARSQESDAVRFELLRKCAQETAQVVREVLAEKKDALQREPD